MNKIIIGILFMSVFLSCKKDSDFLTNSPYTILTADQAYSTVEAATSVLAGLYSNYVDLQNINNWSSFSQFDEAYPSAGGLGNVQMNTNYPYGNWFEYNYTYVRNINLYIELCQASTTINETDKNQLIAEGKFLRAAYYFEMVKREGGIPLILEPLTYNGNVDTLLYSREKEADIYDFIINTMDTLKKILPQSSAIQDRATRGLCLAMETRAALYAGSIAKYGANTPSVKLSGGEVGIPSSLATSYYNKALSSAKELIADGTYSLYNKTPSDPVSNFTNIFIDKNSNPEIIFAQNFLVKSGAVESWTLNCQPHANAEEPINNGSLSPSLNLAMQYEMLDNSYEPFKVQDAKGNYIYYSDSTAIFQGRDPRLAATILLPGSIWKGNNVDIWAGYLLSNGNIITSGTYGGLATLPGQKYKVQVVGQSGPIDNLTQATQTGFYVHKFLDPVAGSGTIGTMSAVWWVRYRYAEVLLNAAEAAFELGETGEAAQYLNQVRSRAGLINPLISSDITFDRIVHERRVELAFEGHEFFDNKRWRIADKVWNGRSVTYADLVANIGKADAPNTQIYGIYPYKIYDPGGAHDGQWVYKIVKPSQVTGNYNFALGNYYSQFSSTSLSSNPKLIQNPNQ